MACKFVCVRPRVKGQKEVIKALNAFGKEGRKAIGGTVQDTMQTATRNAKRFAPVNNGQLRNGITYKKINTYSAKTVAMEPYSAYVEFGTGRQVSVPAEFRDMAIKFKGGGGGTFEQGLAAIRRWVIRKGIDEKAAFPIFMAILRRGITPNPFMYPAFIIVKRDFERDLHEDLQTLTKRFNG